MKSVVITGSSKGFGFEIARCFLNKGYCVTISGRNQEHLNIALDKLKEYRSRLLVVKCDVRNYREIAVLWDNAVEKWGKVDIWINNAGISQSHVNLWQSPMEEVEDMFHINLFGVIAGTQIAVKGMMAQGFGQIFNTEGFGSDGSLQTGINLYGTSKRSLTHITKAFAKELNGDVVKVGLIAPGMMSTDFIRNFKGSEADRERVYKIFNILGDKPEVPAEFLVNKMIRNNKNGAHFSWLTPMKATFRFIRWNFIKRDIFN